MEYILYILVGVLDSLDILLYNFIIMIKGAKLIAVDFDDTLCMTEEATFQIENHIAQRMGFKPMSRKVHIANWGKPIKEAIVERIPGIDPDEFMRLHRKVLPLFIAEGKMDIISPENLRALQRLKDAGKKLAIVTSRGLDEAEHLLDPNHDLTVVLDGFYHKDKTVYSKPDPRVFVGMLQDFELRPDEAVYIGDSPSDAIAAKGAGMYFIASLESGIRKREDFKESKVDAFVNKFVEIEQLM